jgi:hypothetical protein
MINSIFNRASSINKYNLEWGERKNKKKTWTWLAEKNSVRGEKSNILETEVSFFKWINKKKSFYFLIDVSRADMVALRLCKMYWSYCFKVCLIRKANTSCKSLTGWCLTSKETFRKFYSGFLSAGKLAIE